MSPSQNEPSVKSPSGARNGSRSRSAASPADRPEMDIEARRDLKLLEAVERDSRVTQRTLAGKLGVALGLINIYLKRLARKGYIKCVNVQSNRISYLITPRGIAEKARLTYEFMDYSLHLYGEVRQQLRGMLEGYAAANCRVAIYGRGEAAELAYLSLKEHGLEPVAIFDAESGAEFLGIPVQAIRDHARVEFDLVIVATLESSGQQIASLESHGISREKLFPLRRDHASRLAKAGGGNGSHR
jgi:predicted transcriptional regulator